MDSTGTAQEEDRRVFAVQEPSLWELVSLFFTHSFSHSIINVNYFNAKFEEINAMKRSVRMAIKMYLIVTKSFS